MTRAEWLFCPNTPPCPHTGLLHDIGDREDPDPTCCAEGCLCGHPPSPPAPAGSNTGGRA